jgi:diguanylate cyclase (GGDEF)-like protein
MLVREGSSVDTHPFDRQGLVTRAAPFLLAITAAFALTPLQPYGPRPYEILLAVAVAGAIVASVVLVPWHRLPRFAQSIPALAFFGIVVLLSDAGGGAASGYAPLVFLPVVWIALYGRRWELALAIMGVAATFLGPLVATNGMNYPATELGRALAAVAVAVVVGVTVQGLVARLRARAEESLRQADALRRSEQEAQMLMANMAAVSQLTREVAKATDVSTARFAVCASAQQIAEATFAILLEYEAGGLVETASSGCTLDPRLEITIGDEPSGAAAAFVSRQPFFVSDVREQEAVAQRVVEATGVVSMHFQPVVGETDAIGVLALGWSAPAEPLSERVAGAVRTLAAEAAIALERAALLERLQQSARTDELTGLPNRRAWEEQLPRELARARRERQSVCVVMLDLDRFKEFNDREGHQAGDRLLKQCAAAWTGQLRATDTLARYGGEEFSLVLPGCTLADGRVLVERLRETTPEGQTLSAGIAAWDGVEPPPVLVGRADGALYEAKRSGRNRVVTADAA